MKSIDPSLSHLFNLPKKVKRTLGRANEFLGASVVVENENPRKISVRTHVNLLPAQLTDGMTVQGVPN